MTGGFKETLPSPPIKEQSGVPKTGRRGFLKTGASTLAGLALTEGIKTEPTAQIERRGEVATIRKPEATYSLMYGNHVDPRDPANTPDNLSAIVFEGSAGDRWVSTSQWDIDFHKWHIDFQRDKYGLEVLKGSSLENLPSEIEKAYKRKGRVEYFPIFPKLESQRTPIFLADMEFNPSIAGSVPYLQEFDNKFSNFLNAVVTRFPDTLPTLETFYSAYSSAFHRDSPFPAMTHPVIASMAEVAIGASLFLNLLRDRKKVSRREFLKGSNIAKVAAASWLSMPVVESLLFVNKGVQGEFLHPELRKLIEKTHPEVWGLILTLRNVVLAHKEQWLAENKSQWSKDRTNTKPVLGTTIGSAHTGIEDQILQSPEERLKFLKAVQPLLQKVYDPGSVYKVVKHDFDGRQWRPTAVIEIPELKELVT